MALVWLIAIAAPVRAFEPLSPAKTFRFDAPDGHYESWWGRVSCPINAIRGIVRFDRYGQPTTRWRPGITVFVRKGEGKSERLARLAIRARFYRPPFESELGAAIDDSVDLGTRKFRGVTGGKGTFTFLMSWNSGGDVVAQVGAESLIVRMGTRPDTVNINGSTGAGSVTFEFGHVPEGKQDQCKPIA